MKGIIPVTDLEKVRSKELADVSKNEAEALGYQVLAKRYREELGLGEPPMQGSQALKEAKDIFLTGKYLKLLKDMDQTDQTPQAVPVQAREDPIVKMAETLNKLGASKEEVLDFLRKLDPPTLAAMYTAGETNPMIPLLLFRGHSEKPESLTMKDVLDLWKMNPGGGQAQGGVTLDGIANLMNTVLQAVLTKNVQQPQAPPISAKELLETGKALVEPFYQTLTAKEKEIFDTRLQMLESKIVDPMAFMKQFKTSAAELGLVQATGGGAPGESDHFFELEKERVANERWKMEQDVKFQQWSAEQGLKQKNMNMVFKMIGDTLLRGPGKKLLDAAAEETELRIRGEKKGAKGSKTEGMEGFYPCEECATQGKKTLIPVPVGATTVTCDVCKSVFTRPPKP